MKEKKKLAFLKGPLMATNVVLGLIPGFPTYNTRFIIYFVVIVPFLPIIKYASTFENVDVLVFTFFYFFIYIFINIIIVQYIRKIGSQWSTEEYNTLKPDQVTFPFIIVLIFNLLIHFTIYYIILKFIIL